jgi:hypothetical protein
MIRPSIRNRTQALQAWVNNRGYEWQIVPAFFLLSLLEIQVLAISDLWLVLGTFFHLPALIQVHILITRGQDLLLVALLLLLLLFWFLNWRDAMRGLLIFSLGYWTLTVLIDTLGLVLSLESAKGSIVLFTALLIWVNNLLIFAFWYWWLDGGGPHVRLQEQARRSDLIFVQQQKDFLGWGKWHPGFVDYLFHSFLISAPLKASDVVPLSQRIKLLTLLQQFITLLVFTIAVARAIRSL